MMKLSKVKYLDNTANKKLSSNENLEQLGKGQDHH